MEFVHEQVQLLLSIGNIPDFQSALASGGFGIHDRGDLRAIGAKSAVHGPQGRLENLSEKLLAAGNVPDRQHTCWFFIRYARLRRMRNQRHTPTILAETELWSAFGPI